jgi:hypothetical protein
MIMSMMTLPAHVFFVFDTYYVTLASLRLTLRRCALQRPDVRLQGFSLTTRTTGLAAKGERITANPLGLLWEEVQNCFRRYIWKDNICKKQGKHGNTGKCGPNVVRM